MTEAETKASKLAAKMVVPIAIFMFLPMLAIIMFPAFSNIKDSGLSQ
jgi:pilus assembly protein TadC